MLQTLDAPLPVCWKHHAETATLNGGAVELTPRYTLHAAPVARASQRALRNLGQLLEVLRATGLTLGTAAVEETTPAGTSWYQALDDVNGKRHWVRGAGLRLLANFEPAEVRFYSGLCLWGTGAMRAFAGTEEVTLTSGDSRNARHVTAITTLSGLSAYEDVMSAELTGLAGAVKRATALSVHPVLHWDFPPLHYLVALLDNDGRPMLRPALWQRWQREVEERATLVRNLLFVRSRAAGFRMSIARSLAALQAGAHGRTGGRTPEQALAVLARDDEAWRVAASVRTVETYQDLTRLAYAVEMLRAGSPDLHGAAGRLLIVVDDPAEARSLAEARAIAKAAGLRMAAVGLYPLSRLLPSTGGSLHACGAAARVHKEFVSPCLTKTKFCRTYGFS
ncbi:hypothetical protein [Amycolatopsis sp. NPDC059021]|uniref:hypothetical protein n=1 Tax=Amycolatopsis sp. NPDC059021 TaxID=3346704 RepID=UPI00366B9ED6